MPPPPHVSGQRDCPQLLADRTRWRCNLMLCRHTSCSSASPRSGGVIKLSSSQLTRHVFKRSHLDVPTDYGFIAICTTVAAPTKARANRLRLHRNSPGCLVQPLPLQGVVVEPLQGCLRLLQLVMCSRFGCLQVLEHTLTTFHVEASILIQRIACAGWLVEGRHIIEYIDPPLEILFDELRTRLVTPSLEAACESVMP